MLGFVISRGSVAVLILKEILKRRPRFELEFSARHEYTRNANRGDNCAFSIKNYLDVSRRDKDPDGRMDLTFLERNETFVSCHAQQRVH